MFHDKQRTKRALSKLYPNQNDLVYDILYNGANYLKNWHSHQPTLQSEMHADMLSELYQKIADEVFKQRKSDWDIDDIAEHNNLAMIPVDHESPHQETGLFLKDLYDILHRYENSAHSEQYFHSNPALNPFLRSQDVRASLRDAHYRRIYDTTPNATNRFFDEHVRPTKLFIEMLEEAWQQGNWNEQYGNLFQNLNKTAVIRIHGGLHGIYVEPFFDRDGKIRFIKYDPNDCSGQTQEQANYELVKFAKQALQGDAFFDDRFISAFAQGGMFERPYQHNLVHYHSQPTLVEPLPEEFAINYVPIQRGAMCNALQQGYKNIRRFLTSWDSISPVNHLGPDRIADLIFSPYTRDKNTVMMWAHFDGNESRQQLAHEHLLQYRSKFIEDRENEIRSAAIPIHESPLIGEPSTQVDGDNPVQHYIPHASGSGFRPRTKNDIFNWRHYLL